jgi:L-lactate dehydrogenase (cytochrome)
VQADVSERSTSSDPDAHRAQGVVGIGEASLPRHLRRVLSLDDLETAARRHLPRPIFGYVSGAAETNQSLHDNRAAFQELGFLPRVLTDVSRRSQRTTLFGQDYAAPFGLAPMGISALVAYRGDLVLARAATRAGIPMIMSGSSLIRLEEVAQAAPGSWFQAYLPGEPPRIAALVERVARAGFGTLVLTVDTAVLANRENNVRSGFSTPLRPSLRLAWDGITHPRWSIGTFARTLLQHGMPHFENSYAERGAPIVARNITRDFGMRDHLNWTHLAQIRRQWQGHLVVKGIMHGEDARIAREHGVDGIIVSNHGGRQLDGTVSPLRALPGVVAAAGDVPVMMDSGIRRGSDVLKAVASGARFVFVGRSFLYAAAIGGELGVLHAIELLSTELNRDMGLLGINSLAEMRPELLVRLKGGSGSASQ